MNIDVSTRRADGSTQITDDVHLVIRGGELVAYRWGERQWPSNVP